MKSLESHLLTGSGSMAKNGQELPRLSSASPVQSTSTSSQVVSQTSSSDNVAPSIPTQSRENPPKTIQLKTSSSSANVPTPNVNVPMLTIPLVNSGQQKSESTSVKTANEPALTQPQAPVIHQKSSFPSIISNATSSAQYSSHIPATISNLTNSTIGEATNLTQKLDSILK